MATAFIFSSNIEVSGIEKDSNNLRVLCSPKFEPQQKEMLVACNFSRPQENFPFEHP